MSQFLSFAPTVLGFLASMIILMLLITSFATALPNQFNGGQTWIHKLSLSTLIISFVWIAAIYPKQSALLLSEHFLWEPLTGLLSLLIIGLSIVAFIYMEEALPHSSIASEHYLLCLLSLLGALVVITAKSVIVFYLGLEILALPLYGLVAFDSGDKRQMEAAIKYIIMGIVTSILLLYGLCLSYAALPMFSLHTATAISAPATLLARVGATLVFSAFLFKLGVVPFHFWVPDVYQTTSMATALFISTVGKFAAISMGLRLFNHSLISLNSHVHYFLMVLGLTSTFGGNLLALMQINLRRLIAYSSIAHMGPILLSLALPTYNHSVTLFYGASYCFMAVTFFGVLIHLNKLGITTNTIEDLSDLHRRYPIGALLLLIVSSSMAGIPPFIGFFSKFGLLYHLANQHFYTTGIIYLVATTMGTYYYLNIIKTMYFSAASLKPTISVTHSRLHQLVLIGSGLILCSLALYPNTLLERLEIVTQQSTHTSLQHRP